MPCPSPWDGRSATCDRRAAQATRARQPGLEVPAANLGTRDGRAWTPHPRTCRGRRSKAGSRGLQGTRARLGRQPRPPIKRGGSVIHVMELDVPSSQLPPPSVEVRGCQATITRLPDVEGPSARSGRRACQGWRPRHPTLEFAPATLKGTPAGVRTSGRPAWELAGEALQVAGPSRSTRAFRGSAAGAVTVSYLFYLFSAVDGTRSGYKRASSSASSKTCTPSQVSSASLTGP